VVCIWQEKQHFSSLHVKLQILCSNSVDTIKAQINHCSFVVHTKMRAKQTTAHPASKTFFVMTFAKHLMLFSSSFLLRGSFCLVIPQATQVNLSKNKRFNELFCVFMVTSFPFSRPKKAHTFSPMIFSAFSVSSHEKVHVQQVFLGVCTDSPYLSEFLCRVASFSRLICQTNVPNPLLH
jgi:hypothetical protein